MDKNKLTLEDIFNDDEFGLLDAKQKTPNAKSEEDRLIDSFEEINTFVAKNNREPSASSMSEYSLLAKLKNFRNNEAQKKILKPHDKHNLLGQIEMKNRSIEDILSEEDNLGLLNTDEELSIFKFTHTPKPKERAETDFVAQRKSLKEKDFAPYETMFRKVHQDIKEGKRKIIQVNELEKHLRAKEFYLADGLLLYLEDIDFKERENQSLAKETSRRKDGRTKTIFENGTYSNMYYRSLGKLLQSNGKMVTNNTEKVAEELFINANLLSEEDVQTGWIYVLKSQSKNPKIAELKNLYKIGFSTISVDERIKNAKNEATYLFSDVKKVATYKCYNRNADKLEGLLHRFFAKACLNIDLLSDKNQRLNPREWFVVPFEIIEEAIRLILNEGIINYEYESDSQKIKLK